MALNFLSKHGILIGVLTILASLLLLTSSMINIFVIDGNSLQPLLGYSESLSGSFRAQHVGALLIVLLAVILSGLLIFGIVKKRYLLLVPWLIMGFLASVFFSSGWIYETVIRRRFNLENYFSTVLMIGLQILVLHPIWQLFTEIRSVKMAVGNPTVSESNYIDNLQTTYDGASQKSKV